MKDRRQEERGTTEDEMVGWHHWINGHEFEQVPGVGDGQGSLPCYSPWDCKESDTTEWLNWTELIHVHKQNVMDWNRYTLLPWMVRLDTIFIFFCMLFHFPSFLPLCITSIQFSSVAQSASTMVLSQKDYKESALFTVMIKEGQQGANGSYQILRYWVGQSVGFP